MLRRGKASKQRCFQLVQVLFEGCFRQQRSSNDDVNVPPGRLPPMAVKLKGETANTNPSSARYSIRLFVW